MDIVVKVSKNSEEIITEFDLHVGMILYHVLINLAWFSWHVLGVSLL